MKKNADNKHPRNFLQSPNPEERRPPTTATGEGFCPRPPPAPRPQPRKAGRRQREPEARHRLRAAPAAPCPGGGTHSSAATGGSPFRPSLPSSLPPLRQRVRLPDTGTPPPLALRLEPRTLCAETKKPVRALFFSPVRLALSARETPVPQRGQKPLSSFKAGGATALPRGAGFTLQGGENYSPFYSQLHRSSRVGEPRRADPVGGRCGTRGHSPRRSHAGGSGVKAAGAAGPAGEGMEPDTAHGHSFRGHTSSGTPRASTERNINFPALSVVAKSLET